jgi:hypothetical protein
MIEMQIAHHGLKDVISTTFDGVEYSAHSEADLARALVAAGVPDQPFQTRAANGTLSMRVRSLHRHATLMAGGVSGYVKWNPFPSGMRQ